MNCAFCILPPDRILEENSFAVLIRDAYPVSTGHSSVTRKRHIGSWFDLRLGRQIVGVEAAHIRWFQFNGPDTTNNGLALCATHHKMFDLGVFTVTPETLKILFSTLANGSDITRRQAQDYHRKPISPPQSRNDTPNPDCLQRHEGQVFKREARP